MLILVRHGQSEANAAGRLLGRTDSPLTEHGRRQAALVRARLTGPMGTPVVRLLSSPLRRAVDTAETLADGLGVKVDIDDRWIEVDYGEYEGVLLGSLPAPVHERWHADPTFCPPDGESLAALGRRVSGACADLFAQEGAAARRNDGDVVVVSHVSPIKAAVAWALGADPTIAWRLRLSTGSVTRIGWGDWGPVVHEFNGEPSE